MIVEILVLRASKIFHEGMALLISWNTVGQDLLSLWRLLQLTIGKVVSL